MKFKLIVTSILALLALNACFATSVELNSSSLNVDKGDTFSLDLLVKDAPETWAFENVNLDYDENILNLTSITLSEVSNSGMADKRVSDGFISILWMSNQPMGNFTIATLSFESLDGGTTQITLNPTLADSESEVKINVTDTNVSIYEAKPDLLITNVSIDPLKKYETNTVLVTVANNGDFNAGAFKVSLETVTGVIDSDVKESIAELNYGESTVVTFENITLGPNNLFDIIVDSENIIEESDETNNEISFGNQPSENAISAVLSCENDSVKTGETFDVTLTLNDLTANRAAKAVEGELIFDSSVLKCNNFEFQLDASAANETYLENVTIENGVVTFSIVDGTIDEDTTIAIATFEALAVGNSNISLENLVVSDVNGYAFNNVSETEMNMIVQGPDALIESVEVSNPYYMEPAVIAVTVTNNGHQNIDSCSVNVYIDSDELDPLTVTDLRVGESKIVEFNWTPQKEKTFTIVTVLDSSDAISEENEDNNQNTTHCTVTENAISAVLSCENDSVKTGETFDVTLTLNDLTANRAAKAVEGELIFDSSVLKCNNFEFQLDASAANETYLENVTIENGVVTFSIVDGTIDEDTTIAIATFEALAVGNSNISLENLVVSDVNGYAFNNVSETEMNMIVQGPDALIESVEVSNPYYMEPAVIAVTVTNNGHQNIDSCSVNVYIDSDELDPLTVTDLRVGESKIVEFNWTPQKEKTFTIVTVLDSSDAISEENEDNNQLTEQVSISERIVSMEIYKKSETETQIITSVKVSNVGENRQCMGYDVYVSLDNLDIVEVNAIGETTNWSVTNNTLFITGYEFTNYGEFEIANITFNKTNNSISAIISECALSDTNGQEFNKILISNKIVNLDSIKNIVLEGNVSELVDESALETTTNGEFDITKIYFNNSDSIWIPETVENDTLISITNETLDAMKEAVSNLGNIDFDSITSEDDVSDIMDEVIDNMVVVSNYGFNISNITQETVTDGTNAVSELRFTATNTSSKGYSIIRLPVGDLEISEIIVNTGSANVSLEKDDIDSTIGWYRIPIEGILEITLIKDPEVTIKFASAIPVTTTSSSSGSSGGSHYSSDLSDGITSAVIKNAVSNSNIVYGSEIDQEYALNLRETVQNSANYELSRDTIIVGGPEANGFANKYDSEFGISITNDYPGENRGVIQVQNIEVHVGNFIKTYQVIYIAGSDRYGTQAALEYFKTLEDLPEKPVTVEWTENGPVLVE
ncbi:CARDB domain-containing protein [Methanococcus maripaludis]|uniref:Ribosomal protein S11 n=1 Tax=Methanococcus maripaludis TaxID=39152 RepID=A0A7J9PW16_METMI|nr:CARDB domain-containing protein [Methanococcus maripaludis]MBA2868830.1 ribosomal protein S11 [Methanococcus maripaludis]